MTMTFFLPSLREARKSSIFREKLMDSGCSCFVSVGDLHVEKARRQLDVQGAQKLHSG